MSQPNATDPTSDCPRCSIAAVCSDHTEHATQSRPAAAAILGTIDRDVAVARGTGWRMFGGSPSHTAHYRPNQPD